MTRTRWVKKQVPMPGAAIVDRSGVLTVADDDGMPDHPALPAIAAWLEANPNGVEDLRYVIGKARYHLNRVAHEPNDVARGDRCVDLLRRIREAGA